MNPELFRMISAGLVRQALTLLTAYLVSKQVPVPDDFVGNMTNYLVDALPALFAFLWSAIQKSATHDELQQANAPVPLLRYYDSAAEKK